MCWTMAALTVTVGSLESFPGSYTSRNGLETVPNDAPCSIPQYWYLSDPSVNESGPQMDTPGGMCPSSSRKICPSDSTVRMG
jgi:hypothetical protein